MHRWIALIGLSFLSILLNRFASSGSSANVSRLPEKAKIPAHIESLANNYDAWFQQTMPAGGSPGAAVVIVYDSTIVLCRGYGVKVNGNPDPVSPETVFRIGSLSKGFAAVLTGILVQDKNLDWQDKVVSFYPAFKLRDKAQTQRVNLTHLLSHTTGLPYHAYTTLIEQGKSITEITPYFANLPLSGPEGSIYSYQNAAFSCIEEVVRTASGKSYQENLVQKLFIPAGMKGASVTYEAMMNNGNIALPHHSTGGGWAKDAISTGYYNAAAAGGVNANIADMGQWLLLLLGQKPEIVSENTLNTVFQPRIRTENERRFFRHWGGPKESWYGLGFRSLVQGQDTLVFHSGYVNGYKSEIAFDRRNKIGICILFNGAAPMAEASVSEFFDQAQQAFTKTGK